MKRMVFESQTEEAPQCLAKPDTTLCGARNPFVELCKALGWKTKRCACEGLKAIGLRKT